MIHPQVLPLDQALAQAHIRNFDERKEVGAVPNSKSRHLGARFSSGGGYASGGAGGAGGGSPWVEKVGTYPGTGQQFK